MQGGSPAAGTFGRVGPSGRGGDRGGPGGPRSEPDSPDGRAAGCGLRVLVRHRTSPRIGDRNAPTGGSPQGMIIPRGSGPKVRPVRRPPCVAVGRSTRVRHHADPKPLSSCRSRPRTGLAPRLQWGVLGTARFQPSNGTGPGSRSGGRNRGPTRGEDPGPGRSAGIRRTHPMGTRAKDSTRHRNFGSVVDVTDPAGSVGTGFGHGRQRGSVHRGPFARCAARRDPPSHGNAKGDSARSRPSSSSRARRDAGVSAAARGPPQTSAAVRIRSRRC